MIKFFYKITLFFVLFLISCNPEIEATKNRKIYENKYNLINPFYIDKLTHLPYFSINPWFVNKIKIKKIKSIEVKYNNNLTSNDYVENQRYDFDNIGNLYQSSYYYATKDSLLLVDDLEYNYVNNILNKVHIYKYALIGNQSPISIVKTLDYECYIRDRNRNNNDSLFFYPNIKNPEIIKEKIGGFVNYLEVFVSKNTSASSFITKIKNIDSTLITFDIAEKIITYKDGAFPLVSYHLDNKWNVLDKCKEWQYNEFNQPILFMEWSNEKKTKHIELIYNENKLLNKYIFNKKKFIVIYKTY